MSLSEKEKVQLQAKRLKRLKYKATGLYLYHPATDSWIPAQCDDEGRLVIDPSDLDKRYELANTCLKIDGSRKAELIDIDAGAGQYDKLLTKTCMIKFHPSSAVVYWRNRADSAFAGFQAATVYCSSVYPNSVLEFLGNVARISTRNYDNAYVYFDARENGVGRLECARLVGAVSPYFQISRAGDIIGLAGKTLDFPLFKVGGVSGVDGSFTANGKTVTVTKGIITSIV